MLFKADGYTELIQSFNLSLQVSGLKPQTIKHYTSDTKKFLEHISAIPPNDISPNHVRQYLGSLRVRVSPKTIYEVQFAPRKFFRFISEEGAVESNPYANIVAVTDDVQQSGQITALVGGAPSGTPAPDGAPASSHRIGHNVSIPLSVSYQIFGLDSLF